PDLEGIHTFIGAVDGSFQIGSISRNAAQTTTHAEQHFAVRFVCRIPHHHLSEVADLQPERPAIDAAQYQKIDAAAAACQACVRKRRTDMSSDAYEGTVARSVSEVIVHAFEAIHIDNDNRIFAAH